MSTTDTDPAVFTEIAGRLTAEILEPMKQSFIGKEEIIDLLGVALVGGENLFLLGPPGTAKSAIVQEVGRRIGGRVFDYLLTRFTEPNELFGPFDIRRLREGDLITNTQGMLPEAEFVFLDELLNANSAILNSLLTVLNERVFRRGREVIPVPMLMVVSASNHLPEDEALRALFDRFLLRVPCENVPGERLGEVLTAGWRWETNRPRSDTSLPVEQLRTLQRGIGLVDLAPAMAAYVALIQRLRTAGMAVSDRRAVKLQRVIAASALLSGRLQANVSDLWVLRHIWDTQEQQSLLASLVRQAMTITEGIDPERMHPRAKQADRPDPEQLSREIHQLSEQAAAANVTDVDKAVLRDKLGLLAGRCEWVTDSLQRAHLQLEVAAVWKLLGTP